MRRLVLLAAVAVLACGGGEEPPDRAGSRDERAVEGSPLPGYRGIQKARDVSDSLRARTGRLDSI